MCRECVASVDTYILADIVLWMHEDEHDDECSFRMNSNRTHVIPIDYAVDRPELRSPNLSTQSVNMSGSVRLDVFDPV